MPRKAVGDVLREHRNLKLDPADVDDLGGGTTALECHRDVHLILGFWKIASSSVDPGLCADAPATPVGGGRCGQGRAKGLGRAQPSPFKNRSRDAAGVGPGEEHSATRRPLAEARGAGRPGTRNTIEGRVTMTIAGTAARSALVVLHADAQRAHLGND